MIITLLGTQELCAGIWSTRIKLIRCRLYLSKQHRNIKCLWCKNMWAFDVNILCTLCKRLQTQTQMHKLQMQQARDLRCQARVCEQSDQTHQESVQACGKECALKSPIITTNCTTICDTTQSECSELFQIFQIWLYYRVPAAQDFSNLRPF